jgi:cysteine-rich repeat protein
MDKSTFIRGSFALLACVMIFGIGTSIKVDAKLLGTGSKQDPYRIMSCKDLQSMKKSLDSHYEIKKDIDCIETAEWNVDDCSSIKEKKSCSKKKSGCAWIKESECENELFSGCAEKKDDCAEYCNGYWKKAGSCLDVNGFKPIGSRRKPFSGSLNGNGFTISNLSISRPKSNGVGLIGWSSGAVLQDLRILNAEIQGSITVGTAIGSMTEGRIEAVIAEKSSVNGVWGVGGLVGYARLNDTRSVIRSNAAYYCDIEGKGAIGGIVGRVDGGVLEESASVGSSIKGIYGGGGLGGIAENTSISDVYAESDVMVKKQAGGGWGILHGKSKMKRAISFSSIQCLEESESTTCEVEDGGGLVGIEGSRSKVSKSHYSLIKSGMKDKGKGKGWTEDDLKNVKTYKTWDWDRTWKMQENEIPFLMSLPKPLLAKKLHQAAPKEIFVGKKDVIVGTLFKTVISPDDEPATIAVSIDGGEAKARTKSGKDGKYKIENLDIKKGSVITVFVEGSRDNSAMVIIKKNTERLIKVDLLRNNIDLISGRDSDIKYSTKNIKKAISNGGYNNPGIDNLLSAKGGDINVHEDNTLYIGSGVTLELKGHLHTDNLKIDGNLTQNKYKVTVDGNYTQLDGIFQAGSKNAVFNGNVTINGGEFHGGNGTVKFTDDLVGKFNLESGSFISPKKLEVSTDWLQTKGDFKHNDSTVVIKGTSHRFDFPKSEEFYNVIITKEDDTALIIQEKDSMIVQNKLELVDGIVKGGTLNAFGDVDQNSSFDGGTTELRLEGEKESTVQIYAGGKVPKIRLNSKNTTVRLKAPNDIDKNNPEGESYIFENPIKILKGNFIVEGGNMWTYSKLELKGGNFELRNGSVIANNQVIIEGGEMIANGGVMTLNSNLMINGGLLWVNNAEFNANDKVKINGGEFRGGRKRMVFNNDVELNNGKLVGSSLEAHFYGDLEKVGGKYIHNGGSTILKGKTSKLNMDKAEFGHLIINKHPTSKLKIQEATTTVVHGELKLVSGISINGSFTVYGNVTYDELVGTGGTSLNFVGHKTQKLKLANPSRFEGDLIINKDGGGKVKLMSPVHLSKKNQKIQLRSGIFDTNKNDIKNENKSVLAVSKGATLIMRGNEDHPKLNLSDGSTVHYKLSSGIVNLDDIEYKDLILESSRNLTFYPPKKGLVVKNDLRIISGILELKENQTIRIGGSWLNEKGRFISGNGKVAFVGPISRITGNNTFYDLEKIVPPNQKGVLIVDSGTIQRVNGTLKLKGDKCKFLFVNSSINGKPWKLIPLGNVEMKSLNVSGMDYDHVIAGECIEDCIDGSNNINITFKSNQCRPSSVRCGNGKLEKPYEKCDDGNVISEDGCSPFCSIEVGFLCNGNPKSKCTPICGNGVIDGAEKCDDKNVNDSDGCSKSCGTEKGFVCGDEPSVCLPKCGDGIKKGAEECDDKNKRSGDGCSEFCQIEQGYSCTGKKKSKCKINCGNGKKNLSEECDDGNMKNNDGCSDKCTIETGFYCKKGINCTSTCGDGITRGIEQCDDGNITLADGCTPSCTLESGFVCKGEPSKCNPVCGKKKYDPKKCPKGVSFSVKMRGINVAPPVVTEVKGDAVFVLKKDKKLQYSINAPKSQGVAIRLFERGEVGTDKEISRIVTLSGETRSLTDQEIISLYSGKLYLNVATDKYPNGLIRGQLERK